MYKKLYYMAITALAICLATDLYALFNREVYHSMVVKILFAITAVLVATYLIAIIYKKRKRHKRHEQIDKILDKN